MTIKANYIPEPGDIVVKVERIGLNYYVDFEPTRSFMAKHMLQRPWFLIRTAFRIWWFDFKHFVRGTGIRKDRYATISTLDSEQ